MDVLDNIARANIYHPQIKCYFDNNMSHYINFRASVSEFSNTKRILKYMGMS